MSNKKITAIDRFLNIDTKSVKNTKKQVLDEREGLIERIDKVFVTKEGKQLLREQY
jgi:glycerol-3-phosphate responsive antiterminator